MTDSLTQSRPAVTIDLNGHFPIHLNVHRDRRELVIDLGRASQPAFFAHLHEFIWLEMDGKRRMPVPPTSSEQRHVLFLLPKRMRDKSIITLGLLQQPIAQIMVRGTEVQPTARHAYYQLCVSETRTLGLSLRRAKRPQLHTLSHIPYDRGRRRGYQPSLHQPITDLHTHATGQISGAQLLKAALEVDSKGRDPVGYPIELMQLLGLKLAPSQRAIEVASYEFTPLKEEGLACEQKGRCKAIRVSALTARQRQVIAAHMDIAPDRTMLFSEFDREVYRYRNPLAKNPRLAKPVLHRIAEEYKAHGIVYAELSTGSMMDPAWFAAMCEAVEEIERGGGPTIRFLAGVPRTLGPQRTMIMLEKIKYLLRHPYVVGMDWLGYESNKTSAFHWALSHIAAWASHSQASDLDPKHGWDFTRDFILRVHAGETHKNPQNVAEAIAVAEEYGIRLRVAHALTANFDDDGAALRRIRRMAKRESKAGRDGIVPRDLFAFEMCPDSNQAYMTKPLVWNAPLKDRIAQAPVVLGTDGAGIVDTTPRQLAYSALAAGMSLAQLKALRTREWGYIARQKQREQLKRKAFRKRYPGGNAAFLAAYAKHLAEIPEYNTTALRDFLPAQFTGKRPLLIVGASGGSWKSLGTNDRNRIQRMIEHLVATTDPARFYFVLGRVQSEGVSKVLDLAVKRHNARAPENQFAVLGRMAGVGVASGELAETICWVQEIEGGIETVPASMLRFVHARGGRVFAFGGSDFTAEIIHGSARLTPAVPCSMYVPQSGLMGEVAEVVPASRQYRTLAEFKRYLQRI